MPIFYSIDCPRCTILEAKLKEKNIEFKKITDVNEMPNNIIEMAFPILAVDGEFLTYANAVKWVNSHN